MTYTDAIKSGFSLINRRWQLVAVQVGTMAINCVGFFIFVGIPLGIAFIIFGLDLTSLASAADIFSVFRNPAELFSKYLGLIIIIATFFLLYVSIAMTLSLYAFGGSVGMIGRSLIDPSAEFRMADFFKEAKKMFFPMMWFTLTMGVIFTSMAFLLGLLGGGIAAIVSFARGQDSTLALFLGIFFTLVLILLGLSVIFGALAVTVYGFAILFFRGSGVFSAMSAALKFVWGNQKGFLLYILLFAGYFLISFFLLLIVYPLKIVPIVGTIISLPLQIISYIIQSYLGLVIIASAVSYYFVEEVKPPELRQDALIGEPAPDSGPVEDTSGIPAPGQEQPPPGTGTSDQA